MFWAIFLSDVEKKITSMIAECVVVSVWNIATVFVASYCVCWFCASSVSRLCVERRPMQPVRRRVCRRRNRWCKADRQSTGPGRHRRITSDRSQYTLTHALLVVAVSQSKRPSDIRVYCWNSADLPQNENIAETTRSVQSQLLCELPRRVDVQRSWQVATHVPVDTLNHCIQQELKSADKSGQLIHV